MSADTQRLLFVVACYNAAQQCYQEVRMVKLAIVAMNTPDEGEPFWRDMARRQRQWRFAVTHDPKLAAVLLAGLEGSFAREEVGHE